MNIPDRMFPLLITALTALRNADIHSLELLDGQHYDYARKEAQECFDVAVALRKAHAEQPYDDDTEVFYNIKRDHMLHDIIDSEEPWEDWTLGQVYSLTSHYLDTHPARRILAMKVMEKLVPNW